MPNQSRIKIIVASGNEGKILEIKQILHRFEVMSAREAGISIDPEESADNFLGNALIKANSLFNEYLKQSEEDVLVLADDSGICIQALDDEPGIFSARYANLEKNIAENASDEENRKCVIDKLRAKNLGSSPARFVCCVVLLGRLTLNGKPTEMNLHAFGECAGIVHGNERGENGFGYDSLFQPNGYEVRIAELDSETKNLISHRARALKTLALDLETKIGIVDGKSIAGGL